MEERGKEVRVVDVNGKLDKNVVVSETALLQARMVSFKSTGRA